MGGEFEGELIAGGSEGAAEGSAVVGDPIGAGGVEFCIGAGGADGEDARTGRFAGACAGGGVFDDDAIGRRELQGRGAFQIRLRMRLAVLDVAGGDQVMDEGSDTGGAEADFGEVACGRGDHDALSGGRGGEEFPGARKGNHVGDVIEFAL